MLECHPIPGVSQTRQLKIASQGRPASERALIVPAISSPLLRTAPAAVAIHTCASLLQQARAPKRRCANSRCVLMKVGDYFTITSS
jgi:hypothetical protein